MTELAAGIISALILYMLIMYVPVPLRENYRGKSVRLAGTVLVAAISFYLILVAAISNDGAVLNVMLFAALAGMAGWFDDLRNDPEKGFRGHLSALKEGRLSSGTVKLLSITLLAVVFSLMINDDLLQALIDAVLIASCTNFFNLLDLRPGRSQKAAVVLLAVLLAVSRNTIIAGILLPLILFLVLDLREAVMLGDAGSNYTGFLAGMFLSVSLQSLTAELMAAFLFAGLNFLSEKYSFSKIIENNRFLRFIDMLGRGVSR